MSARRRLRPTVAILALIAIVTAACGSSGGGTKQADAVNPDGVLRLAHNLSATNAVYFDLTTQVATPAVWHQMIFDTLLRQNANGGYDPGLADSVTLVDSSTLKVKLHPNVKFSDGTAVDADAVKFGIERNINQGKSGSFEAELYQLNTIVVAGPLDLTINLKSPIAGAWFRILSIPDSSPVSPTAVRAGVDFNKTPIGAGPFTLKEAVPGDHVTLVKNPTYFQADKIKLGGIQFINVTADATENALRSKTVDMASQVTSTLGKTLGAAGLHVETRPTDNSMMIGITCKNRPPFDDVRVRQALNYALDRDELNQVLYDGKAEPMWGWFKKSSPFHDASLDNFYKQDPTKAKQLLADAGKSNLAFDLFFTPGIEGQRAGEIFQQQMAKAGITVTLKSQTNVADFFPNATGAPTNFYIYGRSGINKITRILVPGSFGDVCTWNDPEMNDLIKRLQAVKEDSPEGIDLWKKIQRITVEKAVITFGLFGTLTAVWDDAKVGNVGFLFPSVTQIPDFYNIYIKR
jgi:ABC-type transport system substrate-binding protein